MWSIFSHDVVNVAHGLLRQGTYQHTCIFNVLNINHGGHGVNTDMGASVRFRGGERNILHYIHETHFLFVIQ